MLKRSIWALLRASYINGKTGGGRSRLHQCLVSVNPLEPALLHRWTSLKVKTFPHQGFVKENGCIFLQAIIFILLSVLESNPHKPSASGLMGLSGCWAGMELGSALGADCLPLLEGGTKHPDQQRGKNRVKARAGSMPGQGGCLDHIRDFEGSVLAYSYPAFNHKHICQCWSGCYRYHHEETRTPLWLHPPQYIVTMIRFGTWWCCREKEEEQKHGRCDSSNLESLLSNLTAKDTRQWLKTLKKLI